MSPERWQMHQEIVELSEDHPRYGYRRVTALLRREGQEVNAKQVQRVRRQQGLQVSRRQRKLRRLGLPMTVLAIWRRPKPRSSLPSRTW